MRKILFLFLLTLSIPINAQIYHFMAVSYADAVIIDDYYHWSDWKSVYIPIIIDGSIKTIEINSAKPQMYLITASGDFRIDSKGGQQYSFYVVDQDLDEGMIRFRQKNDGTCQLYINFSNICWVYNIRSLD